MTALLTFAFDTEQDLLEVVRVLNERDASYSIDPRNLSIRITETEASIHDFFSILPDKYKYKVMRYMYGGTT